ncbi:MAG: GTP-binding protein [Candidatus Omnitrophica bacterium]|nr:GTP-binding protein [Candidatus Omnitrophota bacterium]MCM8800207.1 GTP-binding protein [Candidatus Omnitrophota bacterium]
MSKYLESLKFVIVGHVDHGKSTLIGRILFDTNSLSTDKLNELKTEKSESQSLQFAHLLDQFEEERLQDLTIDTTQVFFKTKKRDYIIIDAPGHREFIRNMITGATQAEAAILIVDVKEGLKEQTKRHAYFLSILGIEQLIVVINKMDLVGYKKTNFLKIKNKMKNFLDKVGLKPSFYIPISSLEGENIATSSKKMRWYKGPFLLKSLDMLKKRAPPLKKPFVFPVQDIFKLNSKRLILGKIEAGILRRNSKIKVLPEGKIATVNSIEKYNVSLKEAKVGESVGITLKEPIFVERGNIFCLPNKEPELKNKFKAIVIWLQNTPFNKNLPLYIRCATQKTNCRIEKIIKKIDSENLKIIKEKTLLIKYLEVAEVLIKTKIPLVVKHYNDLPVLGRFVLEDGFDTCAGGVIL